MTPEWSEWGRAVKIVVRAVIMMARAVRMVVPEQSEWGRAVKIVVRAVRMIARAVRMVAGVVRMVGQSSQNGG